MTRRRRLPRLSGAVLLLVALVVGAELALAWLHFQRSAERGSAIVWFADRASDRLGREWVERGLRAELGPISPAAYERAVFSPDGAAVLAELQGRYEAEFAALHETVQGRGARLVVFYVPSDPASRGEGERFFRAVATQRGVPFVSASRLGELAPDIAFLLPWDTHPSRLGHRLMAEALAPALEPLRPHRAPSPAVSGRPGLLGDFPPGVNEILRSQPRAPFVLRTNAQGLRMDRDVPAAPLDQVVLLLGDSFTFGTPLPVEDVYATRLAALLPGRLVVNAGVGGYGIREERALYQERWGEARADIVVLQVIDNDLTSLLWFAPPLWTRAMPRREASESERALLVRLREGL